MRAADRALSTLKGMKRGLRDDTGGKKHTKSEISGVFSSSKWEKKVWNGNTALFASPGVIRIKFLQRIPRRIT